MTGLDSCPAKVYRGARLKPAVTMSLRKCHCAQKELLRFRDLILLHGEDAMRAKDSPARRIVRVLTKLICFDERLLRLCNLLLAGQRYGLDGEFVQFALGNCRTWLIARQCLERVRIHSAEEHGLRLKQTELIGLLRIGSLELLESLRALLPTLVKIALEE